MKTDITSTIDRLGIIKAQIADMQKIERELIAMIREEGAGHHDGSMYRATVSDIAERLTLNPTAAKLKLVELGVPSQWIHDNSKVIERHMRVAVTARSTTN